MNAERVVIVGQGYVGLPLALAAVQAGFEVVAVETDTARADKLAVGTSYISDVDTQDLRGALASGRYRPTRRFDDITGFTFAVICVPTPLTDGVPDLSHIHSAAVGLAAHLTHGACVVLESTTYPGTTDEFLRHLLEEGSGLVAGRDFHLGYSPERIDPGNPAFGVRNTPKLVSGIDAASADRIDWFYSQFVDSTVRMPGCREAELAKLIENTFRHVNIALVNELAMFASALNVDVWAALDGAATKPFGYTKFVPGPGVGGHCLPIDPSFLSWRVERSAGKTFRFIELANDINAHMPDYVVQRLMLALNRRGIALSMASVLVLGLSYKPNIIDTRQSPALTIVDNLQRLGADVAVADPYVSVGELGLDVKQVDLTPQALADAHCVVLVSDHDDFDYQMIADHARFILDTRARLPRADNIEYL